MRKHIAILSVAMLVLVVLCGCIKRPGSKFGNFAKADSVELVQDAMNVLMANHPPAKTRLALVQETGDAFGVSLVEKLRENGYAIAEFVKPAKGDKYLPAVEKPDGMPFAYVLDRLDKGDELRVSLHIGAESLSRLYFVQKSGDELRYVPQGFWTRRQ